MRVWAVKLLIKAMVAHFPEFKGWNEAFKHWVDKYQDNFMGARLAKIEGNPGKILFSKHLCI